MPHIKKILFVSEQNISEKFRNYLGKNLQLDFSRDYNEAKGKIEKNNYDFYVLHSDNYALSSEIYKKEKSLEKVAVFGDNLNNAQRCGIRKTYENLSEQFINDIKKFLKEKK